MHPGGAPFKMNQLKETKMNGTHPPTEVSQHVADGQLGNTGRSIVAKCRAVVPHTCCNHDP